MSIVSSRVAVQTTATSLYTATAGARRIVIANLGPNAIFIGPTSGVTTTNGYPIAATTGTLELRINTNGAVFAISATANQANPADTGLLVEASD
jgi:hypothetical protein